MTDKIVVLSTCATRDEAEKLARVLLDERLAACVNVIPGIRSYYRWQGAIESADECLLLVKFSRELFSSLRAVLEKEHSYEVPELRGLAVARMVGHITFMSDDSMREKFGRRLRGKETFGFDFDVDFEVESYLRYRGSEFVNRFDANSYLYITKAMDYFDLTNGHGSLAAAFERVQARFLVISFSSDWLYPSYQSREIVSALRARNCDVAYVELESNYGHDAFLVDVAEQTDLIRGFLASTVQKAP